MTAFSLRPRLSLVFMIIIFILLKATWCEATSIFVSNTAYFKAIPCFDSAMMPLFLVQDFDETTTSNSLHCAISCHRKGLCTYAIYFSVPKSCRHLSTTEDFAPSLSDPVVKSDCVILKRQVDAKGREDHDFLPQCLAVDTWKVITKEEISVLDSKDKPMKIFERDSNVTRIYPVQSISIDSYNDMYVSYGHGVLKATRHDLDFVTNPLTFQVKLFVEKGSEVFTAELNNKGKLLGPISVIAYPFTYLAMKYSLDESPSRSQMDVENAQNALIAVLMGYRRLSRYPTRIQMDVKNQDLFYDLTHKFVAHSINPISAPFSLVSVKGSFKTGERFVFEHQIYTGYPSPARRHTAPTLWKMDTCWAKLNPSHPSQTMFDVLQDVIKEGKDIRVLYDMISTDVISVHVTDKDVVVNIVPFLTPMKGEDFIKDDPRMNYPVLGSSGSLVGCLIQLYNSKLGGRYWKGKKVSITWFASSRSWSQLLKYDFNNSLSLGAHKSLYDAVMNGTNIRICYTDTENLTTSCFAASQTSVLSEDDILFQSQPVLAHEIREDSSLGIAKNCPFTSRLVSSQGWVKLISVDSLHRIITNSTVSLNSISYFGEM